MSEELKPCPFCGVTVERTICFGEKCIEHPPCPPGELQCPMRKKVIRIEDWNRRSLPEVTEEEIAKICWRNSMHVGMWESFKKLKDFKSSGCMRTAQSILAMLREKGVCK